MGMMLDGTWQDQPLGKLAHDARGHFLRHESPFRNWVTADGSAGPTGSGGFRAESGRYQLYVSLACPWACRALIMRKLKGLEGHVGLSIVNPVIEDQGWSFEPAPGVVADPVMGARYLHELYAKADPHYTGKVTVPMLWDLERQTIVSNESADIMRMFNSAFDGVGGNGSNYYPASWAERIDALNARIYDSLNNGVYKAGFAASQQAYDEAVDGVFAMLDELEDTLANSRFLLGDTICETDWRCFTTLVRFDSVYYGLFKCNLRRLADYPRLWRYARELYQQEGIAQTVDFDHIKRHYWCSHRGLNPSGIVPAGPDLTWSL